MSLMNSNTTIGSEVVLYEFHLKECYK